MATNKIDLMYFTNNSARRMIDEKEEEKEKKLDKKDIKFYRKRILQLTKDLLRGGKTSNIINESITTLLNSLYKSLSNLIPKNMEWIVKAMAEATPKKSIFFLYL